MLAWPLVSWETAITPLWTLARTPARELRTQVRRGSSTGQWLDPLPLFFWTRGWFFQATVMTLSSSSSLLVGKRKGPTRKGRETWASTAGECFQILGARRFAAKQKTREGGREPICSRHCHCHAFVVSVGVAAVVVVVVVKAAQMEGCGFFPACETPRAPSV